MAQNTPQQSMVHMVEYVNTAGATVDDEGPIAVIVIRPEDTSWRPHNIGLPAAKAWRLLKDLERVFNNCPSLRAWRERHVKG